MIDDDDIMTIKTVSRFFWNEKPPFGVWTAGIIWNDAERGPMMNAPSGRTEVGKEGDAHNISGDVLAVLNALRVAQENEVSHVEVLSVNDSVIRTISEYYDGWKRRGWKTSKGKTPDSLDQWHEIKEISNEIQIDWHRRPRGPVDTVKEYAEFEALIEDRENEFWMRRAIDRDPYG